ncbi:MAG: hypothetical protein Q8P67_19425 [archaeon]|nr:hypothetical protein [archaeon]
MIALIFFLQPNKNTQKVLDPLKKGCFFKNRKRELEEEKQKGKKARKSLFSFLAAWAMRMADVAKEDIFSVRAAVPSPGENNPSAPTPKLAPKARTRGFRQS